MATENYTIDFSDPDKDSFLIKAYTSNGPSFPVLRNGVDVPIQPTSSIASSTDLLLYGRALPNYGERINENFVHLLENFSGPGIPVTPIAGQLWHRVRTYWSNTADTAASFGTGYNDGWFVWNESTQTWDDITPKNTGVGPFDVGRSFTPVVDGDYVTEGNGTRLYRYTTTNGTSGWVELAHTSLVGNPADFGSPSVPDADLLVYNGTDWVANGTVNFGSLEPSDSKDGDLWYDTNPSGEPWSYSQLKIYDSSAGTPAFVSVARNYLLRDGDTLNGVLTVTDPSLVQILGSPSGLNDIVPYRTVLSLASGVTSLTSDNITLGTGSPIPANTVSAGLASKVNLTGDTMLGDLTFYTPHNIFLYGSASGSPITARDFTGAADAVTVNKLYVDNAVTAGVDKYVIDSRMGNGSPYTNPNVLYITLNDATIVPTTGEIALNVHTHPATDITNTPSGTVASTNVQAAIDELGNEKAPIDGPSFTGDANFGGTVSGPLVPLVDGHLSSKSYTDATSATKRRAIFSATGSPAVGPYTVPSYIVGRNQTFVTVAGLKQYCTVRGYQEVSFNAMSDNTGLAPALVLADATADEFTVLGDETSKFLGGLGFNVINSGVIDPTDVFHVTTNSTLTAEVNEVLTVADAAGSLNTTTFTFSTPIPTSEYYIWFNTSGTPGLGDPTEAGTGIEVTLTANDSAATVAAAIVSDFASFGPPATNDFTVTSLVGSPGPGVEITGLNLGAPTTVTADVNTGFAISRTTFGGNTLVPVDEDITVDEIATGFTSPFYAVTITIDGGTPQDIIVEGQNASNYNGLVETIKGLLTDAGAKLDTIGFKIRVTSNTYPTGSPTGSSVNMVDVTFTGSPSAELPLFSSVNEFISIDAAVDAQNYDYQEVGNVTAGSTTILFETDPASGIIEILV